MTIASRFVLTGLTLASLAGAALAQTQPAQSTDPLTGPAVKEAAVPGENRQFADGKVKGKDRMGTEIPHRLFMKALDALRGDTADPAIRLSSDQDSKIKTINDAFMDTVSKYRAAHRDEARELIQQLSPEDRRKAMQYLGREGRGEDGRLPKLGDKAKGKGKAPETSPNPNPNANPDAMTDSAQTDPKKSEDAKAKLRELFEGAPKPADTHAQIFAVLTDAQKTVFQKEMDRLKKEAEDRAGERRLDRKHAQKTGAGKDIDINDPSIPDRVRERLKNMTPEQRQQALERIRSRTKPGQGGGDDKPAPTTDSDVNVPTPDPK